MLVRVGDVFARNPTAHFAERTSKEPLMRSALLNLLDESNQALRHAAEPIIGNDTAQPTDEWLAGLHSRVAPLLATLNALTELASRLPDNALDDWSDAHRLIFGRWLAAHFPNEGSAGTIALGDAWQEGLQVGLCANVMRPPVAYATEGSEERISTRAHSLLIIAADVIEYYLIPGARHPGPFVALVGDMRKVISRTTVVSRVDNAVRQETITAGSQ